MVGRGCLGRSSRLFEFPLFPTRFITRPIYLLVRPCTFGKTRYERTYEFHEILGRKEREGGGNIVGYVRGSRVHPRHRIVLALRPGIVPRSAIGAAPSMQGAYTLIARNAISNSMQQPI